jgi:hypothetical protein
MITVLKALIAGSITRQEAAEWATGYITHDVRVPDACLWNALELLGAADVPSTDRPFLYEDVDFLDCLSQLERQL